MKPLENRWYPYALLAPAFLVLGVVSLVPFLFAMFLSFHQINFGRIGDFAGWANYSKLMQLLWA